MEDEPGPPGAEEFGNGNEKQIKNTTAASKEDRERRRSPQRSPRRRATLNRSSRRSRSKSRNRAFSPPRRFGAGGGGGGVVGGRGFRRSPDRTRNRSRSRDRFDRRRDRRSRSRDRFRGRRISRSRSVSPRRNWSPNAKKPASPPPQPAVAIPPPNQQFTAPPPPMFNEGYTTYPNQYGNQAFGVADYNAAAPPPPQFGSVYPPPPSWNMPVPPVEVYATQVPPVWPAAGAQLPTPISAPASELSEDQLKREAAVAQEVENQREELKKQRNDYQKKAGNMKKELKMLKDQMIELSGDAPPSPTTKGYIDENEKLQGQIEKKINTIENVIDMLSGIIGVEKVQPTPSSPTASAHQKKPKKKKANFTSSSSSSDGDSSPERLKTKIIESMKSKRETNAKEKLKEEAKKNDVIEKKMNQVFYDPEMHWCKLCNVFPKTAKDFLNHLHSKQHADNVTSPLTPWHENAVNDEFPTIPNAASKRTPIRGLQFFVPASSWYCKLCKFWMGDLHCASAHLKSKTHCENYTVFFQKNLTFEVDWMAERQKGFDAQLALPPPPPQITSVSTTATDVLDGIPLQLNIQKNAENEKNTKKRKKKSDEKKDKKKRKRSKKNKRDSSTSSSSSSSSATSESDEDKKPKEPQANRAVSSIRVAMRNTPKTDDAEVPAIPNKIRGKWETVHESTAAEIKKKDEMMLSQWNTPQPIISESEKKLLEQLKGKLKTKPTEDAKKVVVGNGSSKADKKDDTRSKQRSPVKRDASPVRERNNRSRSRGKPAAAEKVRARRSRSLDSRGRFKRSRSRDRAVRRSRSRGRNSPFRRRRRSPSRDRRRRSSKTRSRSRSGVRRIEKAVVRYPEFRPRVPEQKEETKKKSTKNNDDDNDRKKSPTAKKTSSSNSGKKLPFIGRMPVLAKKQQDAGNENSSGDKKEDETEVIGNNVHHSSPNYNYAMMMQATAAAGYPQYENMVDYDDLMPDPMQYVTLMGAPPPPPPPQQVDIRQQYQDEGEILPPGIDETETEFVPKPISDAPIPRKGPLPRDFEEALNIIFPGEKKPEDVQRELEQKAAEAEAAAAEETALQHAQLAKDGIHMVHLDETQAAMDEASQMSMNDIYKFSDHTQDVQDMALSDIPAPLPPPPPSQEVINEHCNFVVDMGNNIDDSKDIMKEISLDDIRMPSPSNSEKERRQQELDDLAMLGIDANDLAAQCI